MCLFLLLSLLQNPESHCLIQGEDDLYLHFLLKLYSFSFYIQVIDSFLINSCKWCEVWVQLHYFACDYWVVLGPFIGKTILYPLNCLGTLVENVWVHFWTLNFIPPTCLSLYSDSLDHLLWLCSQLRSRGGTLRLCSSFSQLLQLFWGPLHWHGSFSVSFSVSVKRQLRLW